MFKKLRSYAPIFWHLLTTDLLIYRKNITNNGINTAIIVLVTLFATAYIFPYLGMTVCQDFLANVSPRTFVHILVGRSQ